MKEEPYITACSSNGRFLWFALDPYDFKISAMETILKAIVDSSAETESCHLLRAIALLRCGRNRLAWETLRQSAAGSPETARISFRLRMIANARLGLLEDAARDWRIAVATSA